MAIFDRFKTKQKEDEKPAKTEGALMPKKIKKELKEKESGKKEKSSSSAGILLRPYITEKTALGSKHNSYVFAVRGMANKLEIMKAVEGRYGVMVTSVRTLNTNGKIRRRGAILGRKPGFKKAIVTVADGQKIEIQ